MGRKKYSKELKARIALDAIKGQKTIAELASEYGVHANQISLWKKQLLDAAPAAFSNGKDKDAEKKDVERDHLLKARLVSEESAPPKAKRCLQNIFENRGV